MTPSLLAEMDQEAAKCADLLASLTPMERVLVEQAVQACLRSNNPALAIVGTLAVQGYAAAWVANERRKEMES